jgi:hypothetical protein
MTQKLTLLALAEAVFCLLLWVLQPTMAYIFTLCVSSVAAAILLVSLAAERIEASKISRLYYYAMAATVAAPLCVYGAVRVLHLA